MKIWALIPARGGSKSIIGKNLVPLAGIPLLDYGIRAAVASKRFDRIICSTEDEKISARAKELEIEVDARPQSLCADDTPVAEVAREFLKRNSQKPDVLALVQPTSPFLRVEHIHELLDVFAANPSANSAQTIVPCPHNHHAWNQREVASGFVKFKFAAERRQAYNKQSKPKLFLFGNFVAARVPALLAGESFFAGPSLAIEISAPYDFDLDTQKDLALAEALLKSGLIELPHMSGANNL